MSLKWEEIDEDFFRAKIFGGWLVQNVYRNEINIHEGSWVGERFETSSITFVPDPNHEWIIE